VGDGELVAGVGGGHDSCGRSVRRATCAGRAGGGNVKECRARRGSSGGGRGRVMPLCNQRCFSVSRSWLIAARPSLIAACTLASTAGLIPVRSPYTRPIVSQTGSLLNWTSGDLPRCTVLLPLAQPFNTFVADRSYQFSESLDRRSRPHTIRYSRHRFGGFSPTELFRLRLTFPFVAL
jgi:hypothetical protein